MLVLSHPRFRLWTAGVALLLLFLSGVYRAAQQQQRQPTPALSFSVVVKEADTGDPISQAKLTITFQQPGKLHHSISYGAKTNPQGRYRFTDIPKGTVRLIVTADHHQSYGKEFELEQDGQEVEVKLKKPQPLL